MRRAAVLLGLLALLLCSCGYRLQGRSDGLPGGVRSLHVELFRNATYEPFVENAVTNEMVQRFARHASLEIVERSARAEAVLGGRIIEYSNRSLSYDRDDNIAEYRSQMTVEAVLCRTDNGAVLWKGRVAWQEDYTASSDKAVQDDREQAAIQVVSRRLADELFSRLLDNF